MGEDITANESLFELPENGNVILPDFEQSSEQELPEIVTEAINRQNVIEQNYTFQPFRDVMKLNFQKAGSVFIRSVHKEKTFGEVIRKSTGIYAVDISSRGEFMGMGSVVFHQTHTDLESLPFVGMTRTEGEFMQQGLGLRRLLILNEASKLIFGQTISSGSILEPAAERLWQRLEARSLVEHLGGRYRFKS